VHYIAFVGLQLEYAVLSGTALLNSADQWCAASAYRLPVPRAAETSYMCNVLSPCAFDVRGRRVSMFEPALPGSNVRTPGSGCLRVQTRSRGL
jgi:hypothetical protein